MGAAAMGSGFDFLRFKEDVAQRKVQQTEAELGRHHGRDFDKAFMGQQLTLHVDMLATLQSARNHATGDFQKTIDQGIQTTQQHLEHARRIMAQLQQNPSTTAQRPGEVQPK